MFENPIWIGWAADSWGQSWGDSVSVEERPGRTGGHNAPPLASPRYPQGRRRNLKAANERNTRHRQRRDEEELALLS